MSMKLDLYAMNKPEYAASKTPAFVAVKSARYLSIAGTGAPGGAAFQEAIGALYNVAFTIKMTRKFAGKQDYAVCKLEATWRNLQAARDEWQWNLLIRTPPFVTVADLAEARKKLVEKGKGPLIGKVKLRVLKEGTGVQMLHVGPYKRIGESVAMMEAFARDQKKKPCGDCHEIYLSDPRRVAPAKLRTILRRSVK
jgi:hypothetical protein